MEATPSLKVVVLGDSGVSKTSLVKGFCAPERGTSRRAARAFSLRAARAFSLHRLLNKKRAKLT
jgi:ABC-type taurine transport system ATPase subunit